MRKNEHRSLDSEGLRRKLWIVYLLMFVLPTCYLLYLIHGLSNAVQSSSTPLITTRIGLLLGLPAAIVMSAAAFLLLNHSLHSLRGVVKTLEKFLLEFRATETVPQPSGDEAQQMSHYVARMIEEFRRHVSAIDRYAEQLHAANEQLTNLALVDTLTGLYNRKHALHVLDIEIQRAVRNAGRLSILLVDVDDLDAFRETKGEQVADNAIREIGQTVSSIVRRVDTVARMDTGQFLVLLLETGAADAHTVAQRMIEGVAAHRFQAGQDAAPAGLTVSVGSATHAVGDEGTQELLKRAAEGLLLAHGSGGNRICG